MIKWLTIMRENNSSFAPDSCIYLSKLLTTYKFDVLIRECGKILTDIF